MVQIPNGAVARPLHKLMLIYDFGAWIFKGDRLHGFVK